LSQSDPLGLLRSQIDKIDEQLVIFLNKRASVALEIGKIKKSQDASLYAPGREKQILDRLTQTNPGPFPNGALRNVFREIMSGALLVQEGETVAYLGPAATFTHLACLQRFGASVQALPVPSIQAVFEAVEKGKVHFGIVPVENSIEGVVNHTLDLFVDSHLLIEGEILQEVSHCLMSKTGERKKIKKIYSHSHALAQCSRFLETKFPGIPVVAIESTAMAAQKALKESSAAAIASELAARLYQLNLIEEHIEDYRNNITRFLLLSQKPARPTGRDKTSILFAIADCVGGLYKILRPFSEHQINLTRIESRPSKKRPWEYFFYVDAVGHQEEEKMRTALSQLKETALFVKILGSYKMADELTAGGPS